MNREEWLGKAAEALADRFLSAEDVPPLRISVGWPGDGANRNVTVGQCWPTTASADGVNQIFISPIRGEAETQNVLACLLHEMIHAVDDCASGHRGNFVRMAKAAGLTRPYTSSDNRTEELSEALDEIAGVVGLFPHAELSCIERAADAPEKQGTRQLKVECPVDGYIVRTTRKWLDVGLPICPCGTEMQEV